MLWSRVDAQRTMIAMGEMVRAAVKRKMLIVDDDIGKCIEGNGLGKRGRVVGNTAEGKEEFLYGFR